MAYRRQLTRRFAAYAVAIIAVGQGAQACEETFVLEYDVRNGGFQAGLNDVFIEATGGQFASGGLPLKDWLSPGENVVSIGFDGDNGVFTVLRYCDELGEPLASAMLTGRASQDLAFSVADPPYRAYFDARPVADEGLLAAVERLVASVEARDFDEFWRLHLAMRREKAALGAPLKAIERQMRRVLENIDAAPTPGLAAYPVLGGRVWEVYGEEFAPPYRSRVEMNGGFVPFQTGAFWMKIDGEWSVYRQ